MGISVVNALSEKCFVEVAREQKVWKILFSRGEVIEKLYSEKGKKGNHGTSVTFKPDSQIFGNEFKFNPSIIWKLKNSLLNNLDKVLHYEILNMSFRSPFGYFVGKVSNQGLK